MQPGKDHMVSIYLEVGMNKLGSLQSQICFVKRVSSNALSVFGVETLQTKVAQYTLPLLHCITPCYTTSVYLCYNVLHYITPCCTIYSTSATMCYTTLHHVAQYWHHNILVRRMCRRYSHTRRASEHQISPHTVTGPSSGWRSCSQELKCYHRW